MHTSGNPDDSGPSREVPKILRYYLSTMFEPGFSLGVHAFFSECADDCPTMVDVTQIGSSRLYLEDCRGQEKSLLNGKKYV